MKKLTMRITLRSFLLLVLTFTGSILFAHLSPAFAAQYYVAGDTGVDTNPGTTSQPWKTIQKAADVMVAGDTVNVKGGVIYNTATPQCANTGGTWESAILCIRTNSGTAANYITYRAWPETGLPIIDASTAGQGINISRNYITLDGFKVIDAGKQVTENNEWAIRINSAQNTIIRNNTIDGSHSNGMVLISSPNSIIEKNKISNALERGIIAFLSHNSVIKSNVISNTVLCLYNGYSGNVKYLNNTVSNCSFWGFHSDGTHATYRDLIIYNNIFTNSDYALSYNSGYPYHNVIVANNLFWNNQNNYSSVALSSPGDIIINPLFVDPSNGDYRLQTNSPAINAGADVSAHGVVTDLLDRSRPNAGTYDIGAYEDPNLYVAGDVATSGNGSMQSPFKTIQEAADIASPGDIVNVKGGLIYNTTTCAYGIVCPQNSGTALNKTTYTSWPDTGIATIDGNAKSKPGFALFGKNFIEIKNFNITNSQSGIIAYGTDHLWIQNNISNNSQSGVNLGNGTTNIWVTNNTAVNGMFGFITGSTASSGLYVQNNIASNNSYFGFGANNGYTGMVSENNIAYGNTVADFHFTYPQSTSDTVTNPLFVDLTNQNFRLQPSSPALNAGVNVSAYGITRDILGVPRPLGSAYDIGAYESYSIPVSITSPTGEYVTTTSATISGTASTTATATITKVQYSLNDGAWTDATGNFSFTLNDLAQGNHTVKVRATDSYGNQTHESEYAIKTFVVDTVTPEIKIIKLGLIGNIPNKNKLTYYFTSQTPQVKGVSEANSTVTFATDSHSYSTEADNEGNFSITLNAPQLKRGRTDLSYLFIDKAGNRSETRQLTLIIGEEFFPDWLYTLIVDKGEEIENVGQNDKQDELEKEVGQGTLPVVATSKILITDSENGPIPNTKVQIDNRYYTTDANGFIYVTKLESGSVKFQVKSVSGEIEFDSEKETNEIVVTLPAEAPIEESKNNFNWLWLLLLPVLMICGYLIYKRSH